MHYARDAAEGAGRSEATSAAAVEPAAARAELFLLLTSAAFDASERNRRFLHYVVEETLAGRGDRIKAYDIAVTVFGRDDSFDPQSDPIVRIEASRLRRSLERYYLLAGGDDPVRIEVPKGGYVPAFHARPPAGDGPDAIASTPTRQPLHGRGEPVHSQVTSSAHAPSLEEGVAERVAAEPAPATRSRFPGWLSRPERASPRVLVLGLALAGALGLGWLVAPAGGLWPGESASATGGAMQTTSVRQGPAILVVPFEDNGKAPAHPGLSRGFTREVIAALTRFSDLFVFGPETTFREGTATDARGVAAEFDVDFILTGGVTVSLGQFGVTTSLIDARSGRHLWSEKLSGSLAAAEIIKVRDNVADQVARTLAQPYGVIFNEKAKEIQGKPPQSLTSYECVLLFQQYWRRYDAGLYGEVRACLERAVIADPEYAAAFASLALIYANAYRFDLDQGTLAFDPLPRALELARRAVDLAPDSTHSYQALHLVYWLMNDVERSLEAAERGLALNPNDTELMADLGLRYCMRAQWDKGLPLVRQAYARNPAQSGQYRLAPFLHHYVNARYEAALAEARKVEAHGIIYNHIALAIAYTELGQTVEADAEVRQILAVDPAYGDRVIADLQKRNLHPDLIRVVVDGLIKAGLSVDGSPTRQELLSLSNAGALERRTQPAAPAGPPTVPRALPLPPRPREPCNLPLRAPQPNPPPSDES